MKNTVNQLVSQFLHARQARRRFLSIVLILALVVSLCVFWQLRSDGVAMANETFCGMEEHTHTEECYEQVLTCGLEEGEATAGHTHDASCYDDEGMLVCGLEESEASEGHTHTAACYEERLVCDIPEHTHTVDCLVDDTADLETAAIWEATLPNDLTDDWADNMVAIAQSQIGYTESEANFQLAEDEETRQGYTRYGAWYGNEYGDWDAMFASFCLHYAGVPESSFPQNAGAYAWTIALNEMEQADLTGETILLADAAEYIPEPGDLVFFDRVDQDNIASQDGKADHVGIVEEVETTTDGIDDEDVILQKVTVIEGDSNDAVERVVYDYTSENEEDTEAVATIAAYSILPEQVNEEAEAEDVNEEVEAEGAEEETGSANGMLSGESDFTYEDSSLTMDVHVAGDITVFDAEDAVEQEEVTWDDIAMEVTLLDEESDSYNSLLSYAEEADGDLSGLIDLQIKFYYGEEELDVSDCEITAEITPSEELIAEAIGEPEEETEAVQAVTMSVVEVAGEDLAELNSVTVTENETIPTVEVSVDAEDDYGIMLLDDADPHFTVQFYANIDQILKQHKEGDTDLTVVETHTSSGAQLPTNNGSSTGNYNTSVVELVSDGTGYKLDTETTLTEMYSAEEYEFVLEPDLHSMNKLEVNSDYTLKQIWVLTGNDSTSMNESDWKTYDVTSTQDPITGDYSYNISFTNNESEASSTTIYIAEGSVFRFVYDTTPSDAYVTVNMYDYNIADGNVYAGNSTSSGTWSSGTKYLNTNLQGINNASNYTGSGVKLGFGNNNAGSGLGTDYWGDNQLNKYNNNGLLGCTFGIPSNLNASDKTINYTSGLDVPKMFNEGDATGKQEFSNVQLTFDREGDTYTLKAISDNGDIDIENLDTFTNPGGYTTIFTNNFWPLDKVSYTGMDPLFGGSSSVRYFGNAEGNMPTSDDGTDHNSYFGMNFDIEFSYTKDYVGPLEYFFFGDDDMWVFLDNTLVLDIGGVHSSVGEHVDLWDYLADERAEMGEDETAYHTLSVFYTERGASGSTCYINYTLPTVSSVTPVSDSGSLRVDKDVEGTAIEEGKEFTFTINLTDEEGYPLTNLYNAIVYTDDEENEVENSYLVTDGSTLILRDGWHFVIHNLPVGTVATITETSEDGYSTTWQVVSPETGDVHSGTVASGNDIVITDGGLTEVQFVNTTSAELPMTGGAGTIPFTVTGIAIISAAGYFLYRNRRRKRKTVA